MSVQHVKEASQSQAPQHLHVEVAEVKASRPFVKALL